jgi:hypothetical protein
MKGDTEDNQGGLGARAVRTLRRYSHGMGRVSARLGRAGEKATPAVLAAAAALLDSLFEHPAVLITTTKIALGLLRVW